MEGNMTGRRKSTIVGAFAAIVALAGVSPVAAQSGALDNLRVHGYLTQGYGTSSDVSVFGIPTEGTAEYRTAALQFRYAVTDKDAAVLQFGHRKLGQSVLTSGTSEVGVTWAFYQRRLGNGSVRVGRVPVPAGLLNETRDVGTMMPFYRAPGNFYMEGVEAMDGVTGSYELTAGDWALETAASLGEVNMLYPVITPDMATAIDVKLDGFLAGQTWVRTPVNGVRFGFGAQRWDGSEGEDASLLWRASAEAVRPRYMARAEYQTLTMGAQTMTMYYGQASLRFGSISLNTQADMSDMSIETPAGAFEYQAARDLAAGISWAQASNLVYKLEAHRAKGTAFDVFVDPAGPKSTTSYFIGSVSVSF